MTAWLRACGARAQGPCLCPGLVRVPPESALHRSSVVVLLGQPFWGAASGGQCLPVGGHPVWATSQGGSGEAETPL